MEEPDIVADSDWRETRADIKYSPEVLKSVERLRVEIIMRQLAERGYTAEESVNMWLCSKTREFILSDDYLNSVMSYDQCYQQLEMELIGDPEWMREVGAQ